MVTVKDVLKFCNAAIFFDYKNIGIVEELYQARRCIIRNFHETIPVSRILITLSFIDEVILKIIHNDIENVIEIINDLGANIVYMIGFERVVKDDNDKVVN